MVWEQNAGLKRLSDEIGDDNYGLLFM